MSALNRACHSTKNSIFRFNSSLVWVDEESSAFTLPEIVLTTSHEVINRAQRRECQASRTIENQKPVSSLNLRRMRDAHPPSSVGGAAEAG